MLNDFSGWPFRDVKCIFEGYNVYFCFQHYTVQCRAYILKANAIAGLYSITV